jgi:N-hydroxyarylamine O-acetyltransferase
MKAHNFHLHRYLARIGFNGVAKADIETIQSLMRHQLLAVPFENLDVQAGKIISLTPEDIVEKIIDRKRGGYCYEVNGLFAMALEALGVEYRFVAARPMFYPERRPKTHMAIVVSLNGQDWLCDTGFGSYGIRAPLSLAHLDDEITQDADRFRLTRDARDNYLLHALREGAWTHQYEFNLAPQEWVDFTPANHFNSTHPDTIFTQKILVVLYTPKGRKILLGDVLKTIEDGVVSKVEVTKDQLPAVLLNEFGLRLPSPLGR